MKNNKTHYVNAFKVTERAKRALEKKSEELRRKEYETLQIMLEELADDYEIKKITSK